MPRRSDAPPLTRGVVLRAFVLVTALALGALAVWLIVTSDTLKGAQVGILVGLWGLLLGAFSMHGTRRVANPVTAEPAPPTPGAEIELRSAAALERHEDATARREHEARLEQMLREEVRETMGRELAGLRAEITQLRGELLEKVGGQLRLERIETTRLIGSDLEALQDEVRKLKFVPSGEELSAGFATMPAVASLERIVEHSASSVPPPVQQVLVPRAEMPRPEVPRAEVPQAPVEVRRVEVAKTVPAPAEPIRAEPPVPPVRVVPAEFAAAEQTAPIWPRSVAPAGPPVQPVEEVGASEPAEAPEPAAKVQPVEAPVEPVGPVEAVEPVEAVTERAPSDQGAPAPAPDSSSMFDELASLPRLRPFTEFELEPIPASDTAPQAGSGPERSQPPGYHGRRRSGDDDPSDSGAARHASTGRRHRRAAEDEGTNRSDHDDLLARLLARESVR